MKGVGSRDKVMHNERSNQLFLDRMMSVAEQDSMDEERVLRGC